MIARWDRRLLAAGRNADSASSGAMGCPSKPFRLSVSFPGILQELNFLYRRIGRADQASDGERGNCDNGTGRSRPPGPLSGGLAGARMPTRGPGASIGRAAYLMSDGSVGRKSSVRVARLTASISASMSATESWGTTNTSTRRFFALEASSVFGTSGRNSP